MALRLLSALLDLVYPPRCVVCSGPAWDGPSDALCALCQARLPGPRPRCPGCGQTIGPEQPAPPCPRCPKDLRGVDGVAAAWSYAGVARDLVLALKFAGRLSAAAVLARGLTEALVHARIPGDLLVPVPLSARRLRSRGYNQAEVIARHVALATGLDLFPRALVRRRHTPPQTGLPRGARRRGPRGAFRAKRRLVAGRCVILVDDVLTTGATVRACALALRRAGAVHVVAAAACRTERG